LKKTKNLIRLSDLELQSIANSIEENQELNQKKANNLRDKHRLCKEEWKRRMEATYGTKQHIFKETGDMPDERSWEIPGSKAAKGKPTALEDAKSLATDTATQIGSIAKEMGRHFFSDIRKLKENWRK
jgi:hypothetical protein